MITSQAEGQPVLRPKVRKELGKVGMRKTELAWSPMTKRKVERYRSREAKIKRCLGINKNFGLF